MASFYISLLLFRIVLPLIIGICVIIRPCGLSAIYLAFLCYLPIVPVPTESSMAGHTGIYLKILIGVSMLTSISQITFQIVLASLLPYGHFLENCKFLEKILRHVGFVRYDTLATINVVTWVTPEILMVFASIMIYRTCSQLCASSTTSDTVEDGVRAPTKAPRRPIGFVVSAGKYMVLIAMCFAAVLRPSLIGGLYFLIFLITATWWSCCKQLRKGFAIVLRCLMVVVLGHLIVLYGYQFQWPQELLDKNSTYARYFGLTPIITVDCADDPRKFVWSVEEWATYVNPIAVFLLYYILAVESKFLLNPQSQKKQGPFSRLDGEMGRQLSQRLSNRKLGGTASTRHKWQSATRKVRMQLLNSTVVKFTESTPLIRGVSPKAKRYGSGHRKAGSGALQDSTGSVTITGENTEDIPMEQLGTPEEEYKPTVCENIMFGLETVLHVIIKSSYIGTNIIMMAWSITYLSWITFVLLLWANLLWLVPNQRKSMLRSSPFLVFYAWFLLISAYIYSMNLTEDELPSTIQGINLAQIGFDKVTVLPCNQLMVKCVFTVMFWVTLRQYMQELRTERQNNALADMVSPLQVSVGTATTGVNNEAGNGGSEFMNKFGVHLRKFLTKFWIWVVAITLFAVAITGERMTGFRILYMALFLFFVLSFQLSFHVWRKMMFGFWLTVIVYSMIILVMVYTYQFDHFQDYWRDYFHVDLQQQLDIGLEKFETKQLFVRLVTPTFFVIIAVIQVHYFHKDFMELSDPRNASPIGRDVDESSLQGGALQDSSEKDDTITSSIKYDVTNSHTTREKRCARFLKTAQRIVNIVYVFLELHMPKFVLFFLVLVCVFDKCAIYISLAILIVLACTLGRAMQMFSIYCSSIIVSVMLLARMIYQIEYINPSNWNVTCELGNDTVIENNAKWFGFNKTSSEIGLPRLVRWNIMYILMVTIMSVVFVRQFNYRASRGKPTTRAFFMFPRITRNDADKDLLSCFKYFANYGFYKFGVEICLMVTVILIGTRIDMYAVFYGLWLCALFSLQRKTLARIWNIYLLFIAISIIIQYLMTVGFPPTLCFLFPWDKNYWGPKDVFIVDMYERLQSWAYLFDTDHPPPAKKLLCDFVLLIFVSRQSVVFRIEKRYEGQYYAGGSNESIIEHAEDKDFNNPVPDFITHVCSYVDVFKRGILMGHIWVTLAIVFLAGTNRVNIFSIGYLCCAFIFLWQGSDLYLRPIPRILKLWNGLLTYNVSVILIKTSLQIVGCVFINNIPSNSCWLIQLLGIGCVDKFEKLRRMPDIDDLECKVPREFVGLVWDGLCFGFLLAQRRIFQSYNFFHMINEIKATTILTSRGAELIEELRVIRMAEQDELERNILEKIKAKMDKIKATQQKIRGANFQDTDNHHVEQPPLAHSSSMSSCASATSQQTTSPAGYHTPIEDDDHVPLTPRSSLIQPQAPSPYSAVMTVSLEGYLEPQRMSFGSPPNSELNPRPPSPDDSFPVFSPPPYDEAPPYAEAVSEPPAAVQRQTSIGPPWMQGSLITPRQSVISYSSRSPLSHHEYTLFKRRRTKRRTPKTYRQAIRSGDYYMFDDLDDDEDLNFIENLRKDSMKDPDEDEKPDQVTVGQFLSTALKTDIGTAVRYHSDLELKRRLSMPMSRQKSITTRSQISVPFSAPPTIEEHPKTVTIIKPTTPEPQPGTSKDEDYSELELTKTPLPNKILNFFQFLWAFVETFMITLTNYLNKYSKDYRYVIRVLSKEKKLLKGTTDFSTGIRVGRGQVWQPAASYHSLLRQSREESLFIPTPSAGTFSPSDSYRLALIPERMTPPLNEDDVDDEKPPMSEESDTKAQATSFPYSSEQDRRKASVLTVPEIRILAPSLERGLDSTSQSEHASQNMDLEEYETTEMSSYDQPTIIRLLLAIWQLVLCHSELVCYFVIFLNQIKSATFLSLPLPLMVFLWGTLTIPRPNKNFWVTVIAYTEVIVLIKCCFQFDIIPWNLNPAITNNPFYPPRIIGIERTKNYAVWDLLLLLVVFFHRFMLKSMGLWKTSEISDQDQMREGVYHISPDGVLVTYEGPEHRKSMVIKSSITVSSKVILLHKKKRAISICDSNSKTSKDVLSPARRPSDLQRLVEEGEDQEVDDKKPEEGEDKILRVEMQEIEPSEDFPLAIKLASSKYADAFKIFFRQLRDPTSRIAADVYSYMFLCDFFNFFVIIFGYASFGTQQGDGGVSSYLEDNRVPVLFLLMLIMQFMLIIVDRGIFLRKNILCKIIFQFVQVFILHVWLFILFPIITERQFNSVLPPQMYYMVKCFYLLLSAYQIRCGYPTRILGNFLCKGYNYINMILFKVFMIIPFVYELRTIMDWMWTDTSMTVFDWMKMEDIFAHIFQLKCSRHCDDEYPQPRGEKKNPVVKYAMGGGILAVIIAVIWFPLVFFSLGNAVGISNPPFDVTLDIRIGPYEPVYTLTAQDNSIFPFTEGDLKTLQNVYAQHKYAATFISNYQASDIAAVKLSSDSSNIWSISPPDRQRMVDEVKSTKPITIRLEYLVSRKTSKPEDSATIRETVSITIPPGTPQSPNFNRQLLLAMLDGNTTTKPMILKQILPKFLKVTNRGKAEAITQLMFSEVTDDRSTSMRTLSLSLKNRAESTKEWWTITEDCRDVNYNVSLRKIPYVDCDAIILYTFNDKIFPSTLSIITGGGIFGMYALYFFVFFRITRTTFLSNFLRDIWLDDMPNVDRIYSLINEIYIVRTFREYALEEDLFAKLVFLLRSRELSIKLTRKFGNHYNPEFMYFTNRARR